MKKNSKPKNSSEKKKNSGTINTKEFMENFWKNFSENFFIKVFKEFCKINFLGIFFKFTENFSDNFFLNCFFSWTCTATKVKNFGLLSFLDLHLYRKQRCVHFKNNVWPENLPNSILAQNFRKNETIFPNSAKA